jgi:hypothetical protein
MLVTENKYIIFNQVYLTGFHIKNMRMNIRLTFFFMLAFGTVSILDGCVSSEEMESGENAGSPITMTGASDSLKAGNDSEISTEERKAAPDFRSNQDTLDVSIVTKSKQAPELQSGTVPESHSIYTVQIGAYGKAANALRIQKTAKERFPGQPVFSEFLKDVKMYRVNIGRYNNREDAVILYDSIKQKYPEEYKQCWVNFIP